MVKAKNIEAQEEIQDNCYKYAQFFQAQMSSYELSLLYYNALSDPKTLRLIKKYKFLENLSVEDLIDPCHNCEEGINLKSRKELFEFNEVEQ